MGQRASQVGALDFSDVRLPGDALLGVEGRGFHMMMSVLDKGRVGIAALAVGIGQAGLEAAEASLRTAGRLLDWDPTDRLALRMQSVSEGQRALMLRALGRTEEALPIVEARVTRARAAAEAAPDDLDAARSLAIALGMRAGMVAELSGAGAACPLWSETRAAWDALDARQPLSALDRQNDYAFALAGLAACP